MKFVWSRLALSLLVTRLILRIARKAIGSSYVNSAARHVGVSYGLFVKRLRTPGSIPMRGIERRWCALRKGIHVVTLSLYFDGKQAQMFVWVPNCKLRV